MMHGNPCARTARVEQRIHRIVRATPSRAHACIQIANARSTTALGARAKEIKLAQGRVSTLATRRRRRHFGGAVTAMRQRQKCALNALAACMRALEICAPFRIHITRANLCVCVCVCINDTLSCLLNANSLCLLLHTVCNAWCMRCAKIW